MSCHSLLFLRKITNLSLYTCSMYFPLCLESISYTSFPMINCYSLIIASSTARRVCINDVTQLCHTSRVCPRHLNLVWKSRHTSLHLELSLVSKMVFISQGGSTTLWSSFFRHGVSDPGSLRFMFIGVDLELSSLVLRNKSHPSFLVGGCSWPFLQFKCTSFMVRTIS